MSVIKSLAGSVSSGASLAYGKLPSPCLHAVFSLCMLMSLSKFILVRTLLTPVCLGLNWISPNLPLTSF